MTKELQAVQVPPQKIVRYAETRDQDRDEIDFLDILRFAWQVRWGATLGAFAALTALILVQLKQPILRYVRVPVSIDKESLYFVANQRDLIPYYNNQLGSQSAFDRVVKELSNRVPGFQDAVDRSGVSIKSMSSRIVPPGNGPIAFEESTNPNDLYILTILPSSEDRGLWMQTLIEAVNRQILDSNEAYRRRFTNISRETAEGAIKLASDIQIDDKDNLTQALSQAAEAKLKLGAILSDLQKLNMSKIDYQVILQGQTSQQGGSPSEIPSHFLSDLALLELSKAIQFGRIDSKKAEMMKNDLIKITSEITESNFRFSSTWTAISQLKSSIDRFEQTLRKDLDIKLGLLPKLLVNDQASLIDESIGPFKGKKWRILIIPAIIIGLVVGGLAQGLVRYLRRNWQKITR